MYVLGCQRRVWWRSVSDAADGHTGCGGSADNPRVIGQVFIGADGTLDPDGGGEIIVLFIGQLLACRVEFRGD